MADRREPFRVHPIVRDPSGLQLPGDAKGGPLGRAALRLSFEVDAPGQGTTRCTGLPRMDTFQVVRSVALPDPLPMM